MGRPLEPRARWRHESVQPDDRRDGLAVRRVVAARSGVGTTPNRRSDDPANQVDRFRAVFRSDLPETTSVHFHGVAFDDFFMDGVPFVTEKPGLPREDHVYEFRRSTRAAHVPLAPRRDRPGRTRAAREFIVDPPTRRFHPTASTSGLERHPRRIHDQRPRLPRHRAGPRRAGRTRTPALHEQGLIYIRCTATASRWSSLPATATRSAARRTARTSSWNPGERWDALITAERLGVWAFHCHILSHVEGMNGMFGWSCR